MKIKSWILIAICSLALTGCSAGSSSNNQDTKENSSQQQEINKDKNDKQDANTDENNQSETDEDKDKNKGENEQPQVNKEEANDEIYKDFKIYTTDIDDTEKVIEFKSIGDTMDKLEDKSVESAITKLCLILQEDYFNDDKIKITLQTIDDKGIATINLENKDEWNKHFQGSTGGEISKATIIETLLQKEYKGEWITGLKVLVDGDSDYEFDHASFNETFNR